MLENPKFDLIKWHLDYLSENNLFHKQYQQLHRQTYDPTCMEEDNEFVRIPSLVHICRIYRNIGMNNLHSGKVPAIPGW